MYRRVLCVLPCISALLFIAPPLHAAEAQTDSGIIFTGERTQKRMFLVRRLYDFSKDIAGIRSANEPGHQAHLLQFGQSVVGSALLDESGTRIGSLSISNLGTEDEARRYVYDDPFTQGGIYKEITIAPVDLYKVDGAYNRAPAWFAPELQRRQQAIGFDRPVKPTGLEPTPRMYLIRKDYAARAVVDDITSRLQEAHLAHLQTSGRNVISASIKTKAGESVSSLAVGDYRTWEDVTRYVYDDPYTKAGMFKSITIEYVDLYKLDGSYERAPAWFYDEMKRRQAAENAP